MQYAYRSSSNTPYQPMLTVKYPLPWGKLAGLYNFYCFKRVPESSIRGTHLDLAGFWWVGRHLLSIQCGPRTKQQLLQHRLDAPGWQISNKEMINTLGCRLTLMVCRWNIRTGTVLVCMAELLPHEGLSQPITLVCHPQTPAQPSALMFFLYHSAHPQSVQLDQSICIENYCQMTVTEAT